MSITTTVTNRGFMVGRFIDRNGIECSIQQSSAIDFDVEDEGESALENPGSSLLWLGVDNVQPKIMANDLHVDNSPVAIAARNLRSAQKAYMADRSNDRLGTLVASAEEALDVFLDETPSFNRRGWVDYPIPKEVLLSSRMHLSRSDVKSLVNTLNYWLEHGQLPDAE